MSIKPRTEIGEKMISPAGHKLAGDSDEPPNDASRVIDSDAMKTLPASSQGLPCGFAPPGDVELYSTIQFYILSKSFFISRVRCNLAGFSLINLF